MMDTRYCLTVESGEETGEAEKSGDSEGNHIFSWHVSKRPSFYYYPPQRTTDRRRIPVGRILTGR